MKKALTVLATVAALAVSSVAMSGQAEARWGGHGGWGHRGGWGWGGPVLGGLAAGALLGGAYAYGPGYYGYYDGPYAYGGCRTRRVWTPYGWRWRRYCY